MKPGEKCQGGGPVSTLRSLTGLGSNISHEDHRYGGPPTRRYARLIAVKATILHSRFVFSTEYLGYVWLPVQLSSQTAHNIANTQHTHARILLLASLFRIFSWILFLIHEKIFSPLNLPLLRPCACVCVCVCMFV